MPIIETLDGPISYLERGAGVPIALLHGIQGTARTWDTVSPLLASRYRVVAPNLRGRSDSLSPGESEAYRLDAFASDLSAVLDMIDRPTVLVAWSMGVSVALELLRQRSQPNILGLMFVSGSPCVGNKADKEARWFSETSVNEVAEEARARAARLSLVEAAEPHVVAASWLHVQQADFRSLLPTLTIPTTIVHGVDDDQCPITHGRLMAQSIPGARLEEWMDTGHNPMAKDPERFADTIARFAKSLS
jgi:pimeloyl-ACP methyl ester carboxylesterase